MTRRAGRDAPSPDPVRLLRSPLPAGRLGPLRPGVVGVVRHGSLFSGYGGLDIALAEVLGARTAWHCEDDRAASAVLAHHWPGVPNLGDITAVDWSAVEPVDVLSGGFPCQGLSLAGRRAGLADPRSGLWSYMAAAINELRPTLVVVENVRGLLSTRAGQPLDERDDDGDPVGDVGPDDPGLGDRPDGHLRALGVVLAELAELGYDATWCGLPASAVGAPHPRYRVFILATPDPDAAQLRRRPEVRDDGLRAEGLVAGAGHPEAGLRGRDAARLTTAGRVPVLAPVPDPAGQRRDEGRPEPAGQRRGPDAAFGRGSAPHTDGLGLRGRIPAGPGDQDAPRQGRRPAPEGCGTHIATDPEGGSKSHQPEGGYIEGLSIESLDRAGIGDRPGFAAEGVEQLGGGPPVVAWGPYGPAIARWERVTGRPAPAPTEPGPRGGRPRPSPAFPEWMMGLPAGWITDTPGVTRNDALHLAGNGVVPQQAAAALRWLLAVHFGQEAS